MLIAPFVWMGHLKSKSRFEKSSISRSTHFFLVILASLRYAAIVDRLRYRQSLSVTVTKVSRARVISGRDGRFSRSKYRNDIYRPFSLAKSYTFCASHRCVFRSLSLDTKNSGIEKIEWINRKYKIFFCNWYYMIRQSILY